MSTDQLSLVFGALADPTRRAILARLREGDATVGELAAPFRVSQPAISRHLKVLQGAGLISRSRRATARLSHLEAEPLREATDWLVSYREFWEASYQRLDELLATLQQDQEHQQEPNRPGALARPEQVVADRTKGDHDEQDDGQAVSPDALPLRAASGVVAGEAEEGVGPGLAVDRRQRRPDAADGGAQ